MRSLRVLFLTASMTAAFVAAACGDDDNNIVRTRPDGGDASTEAGGGDAAADGPVSSCGISLPATYDSPSYDTNASVEIGLRMKFDALLKPMKDAENDFADGGTPAVPPTKVQLTGLYTDGTPNVRSITTPFYQAKVDAWIDEYVAALGDGTWTPAGGDGPTPPSDTIGGTYGKYVFNGRGVDLRQVIEKGTYIAGFYNHAAGVVAAGTPTEATIDRLVAAFGAHPSFPGDPAAAQNKDINSAAYAARRSKDPNLTGPYPKIKVALIKAKASIAAGAKCDADRDAALKEFFSQWERSNYATVVYYFNKVINTDLPGSKYVDALHAYGECIGFIGGFRTVPQDKRIITDAQIDKMLSDALAPNGGAVGAYRLETNSISAAAGLQQVISDIKAIYGFSDAEIASFKNFN